MEELLLKYPFTALVSLPMQGRHVYGYSAFEIFRLTAGNKCIEKTVRLKPGKEIAWYKKYIFM